MYWICCFIKGRKIAIFNANKLRAKFFTHFLKKHIFNVLYCGKAHKKVDADALWQFWPKRLMKLISVRVQFAVSQALVWKVTVLWTTSLDSLMIHYGRPANESNTLWIYCLIQSALRTFLVLFILTEHKYHPCVLLTLAVRRYVTH